MDYDEFLSDYGNRAKKLFIREMAQLLPTKNSKRIFLAGGVPNPNTFPIESIKIKLKNGDEIDINKEDTQRALQYGTSEGHPGLIGQLKKFLLKYHNPPLFDKTKFVITSGSQDALNMALQILINPGDCAIVPMHIYSGVLASLDFLNAETIGVEEDSEGMSVIKLKNILESSKGNKRVKVIYLNPNSCNPSGISYTEQRRKEIYQLAREYNVLIIEDDAYYYLAFNEKRPKSFLTLDTDGRVIRLESFSKIISPGFRLGFAAGPKPILDKMECLIQVSIQQASSLAQEFIYQIFNQWGESGFEEHIKNIQKYYKHQVASVLKSAEKWLKGLAEWTVPDGGFFIWFKIYGIKDSQKTIFPLLLHNEVVIMPGKHFIPGEKETSCIRVSFSLAKSEEVDEGFKKLAAVIKEARNNFR